MNIYKALANVGRRVVYRGGAQPELGTIQGVRGTRFVMVEYADGVKATSPEDIELFVAPEDAYHVLWHFGYPEGREPGSFVTALMRALQSADRGNQAKLALVYPGLTEAMRMAKEQDDGIDQLKELIRIGRETPDNEERKNQ